MPLNEIFRTITNYKPGSEDYPYSDLEGCYPDLWLGEGQEKIKNLGW